MNYLTGRTCKLKLRPNGPRVIRGRILEWYNADSTREHTICGIEPPLRHSIVLVIELLTFDKGKIVEIPSEWVELEEQEEPVTEVAEEVESVFSPANWTEYYLDFTNVKKDLPKELWDELWFKRTHDGLLIEGKKLDYSHVPFDASISIKDEMLVIGGGFGESGYGTVEIKIPLKDANSWYRFYIEIKIDEDEDNNKAIQFLNKLARHGVGITHRE